MFLISISDATVVRVGFELMKYTVSERAGEVAVCLVASSAVPRDLSFSLHTEQISAEGKTPADLVYFPIE